MQGLNPVVATFSIHPSMEHFSTYRLWATAFTTEHLIEGPTQVAAFSTHPWNKINLQPSQQKTLWRV